MVEGCWILSVVAPLLKSLKPLVRPYVFFYTKGTSHNSTINMWRCQSLAFSFAMSTLFLVALMALAIVQNSAMSDDFNQLFQPNWAPDHISTEGDQIKLTLDTISGNLPLSLSLSDFERESLSVWPIFWMDLCIYFICSTTIHPKSLQFVINQ